MSRYLSIMLSLLLLFFSLVPHAAVVTAETAEGSKEQENTSDAAEGLGITAKAAVLIDNQSGKILYEKEKDTELIPASITKIMTLLLIFDSLKEGKITLEDTVTVSDYAASMGGSQVFLEPGETQDVNTMIKCISIASANDAAVAMAEYIAGSESSFVKMMNERAAGLGMEHTKFKNCSGLDDSIKSGHYSSAYDVALMSRELISNYPEISNYSTVWMDEITHTTKKGTSQFGLTNTNKLIRTYNGITGLKTGSTSKAKYCLSATAERNGVSLTAVIMAAPDYRVRFSQAASLLDYGFANCTCYEDKTTEIKLEDIPVRSGIRENVIPRVEKNFRYTLCQGESADDIEREILYDETLTAPVKEGDVIGCVAYSMDGEILEEIPIVASETIEKAEYPDYVKRFFRQWMGASVG